MGWFVLVGVSLLLPNVKVSSGYYSIVFDPVSPVLSFFFLYDWRKHTKQKENRYGTYLGNLAFLAACVNQVSVWYLIERERYWPSEAGCTMVYVFSGLWVMNEGKRWKTAVFDKQVYWAGADVVFTDHCANGIHRNSHLSRRPTSGIGQVFVVECVNK